MLDGGRGPSRRPGSRGARSSREVHGSARGAAHAEAAVRAGLEVCAPSLVTRNRRAAAAIRARRPGAARRRGRRAGAENAAGPKRPHGAVEQRPPSRRASRTPRRPRRYLHKAVWAQSKRQRRRGERQGGHAIAPETRVKVPAGRLPRRGPRGGMGARNESAQGRALRARESARCAHSSPRTTSCTTTSRSSLSAELCQDSRPGPACIGSRGLAASLGAQGRIC